MSYQEYDISSMGYMECYEMSKVLDAWSDQHFDEYSRMLGADDIVWNKIGYNSNSGYVFLVNEDYSYVLMADNRELPNGKVIHELYPYGTWECTDCQTTLDDIQAQEAVENEKWDYKTHGEWLCPDCLEKRKEFQEDINVDN